MLSTIYGLEVWNRILETRSKCFSHWTTIWPFLQVSNPILHKKLAKTHFSLTVTIVHSQDLMMHSVISKDYKTQITSFTVKYSCYQWKAIPLVNQFYVFVQNLISWKERVWPEISFICELAVFLEQLWKLMANIFMKSSG